MADELEPIVLTFGGGINRRRRPFDINPQECFDGENFDLDHQLFALHRRTAFQLMGTAPNAQSIRGYAQLVTRTGAITTLVQAGGNIYSWDGETTFTLVGTCSAGSRLRGMRGQIFQLEDIVIITDLAKLTAVLQWDGTNLSTFSHNLSSPLYAKFCRVHNERAYFGNVQSGTDTPHVVLVSALTDPHTLTVSNRPSSSLSDADPCFIPSPDLKVINGLEEGFGQLFISTAHGKVHVLSGTGAQDYSLDSFYDGSAVSGDEAMVNIGNDILMGLPARIETLTGTQNFGDVETDDVSNPIKPLVENVTDWQMGYDQRLQKVYCFPNNKDECWVLNKTILYAEGGLSPWSKWTTTYMATFQPSTVLQILDPPSGLAAVFMGDATGNIYNLNGRTGRDGAGLDKETTATHLLGTSGYYNRGAALTGAPANTPLGLMNFWMNPDSGAGSPHLLFDCPGQSVRVSHDGTNGNIGISLAGGASTFEVSTAAATVPTGQWTNVIAAWNTNFASGSRDMTIVVNGTVVSYTILSDTGPAFSQSILGETNWFVGVSSAIDADFDFNGCVTEFYYAAGQFLNLNDINNVRKFINQNDRPVDLGADGSSPTGTSPIIYLTGLAADFDNNIGTGGNFTTVGSPTNCADAPAFDAENVSLSRTSMLYRLPENQVFDVTGSITYLKSFAATVTLTFLYGGSAVFEQAISIPITAASGMAVYSGEAYYSGSFFYNTGFEGRLTRREFSAAGNADFFQLKIDVDGTSDIEIHEIIVNLRAAEN